MHDGRHGQAAESRTVVELNELRTAGGRQECRVAGLIDDALPTGIEPPCGKQDEHGDKSPRRVALHFQALMLECMEASGPGGPQPVLIRLMTTRFACDMTAIPAEMRGAHHALIRRLMAEARRPPDALPQRLKCRAQLRREECRLFPRREVAAAVDLVEVGEAGVDRLDPAARCSPELAGERRKADRN